jgi:RNA polymerase sigma-70 factor, ECF subfamily
MKLPRNEFEKLVLEQLDLLFRVARRLTHSTDGAADLVQETFLRAIRAHATFDLQERGIRPWLVRVMQNLHFSRTMREKRQPVPLDSMPLEQAGQKDTGNNPPPGSAGWDGMDERLVKALQDLPPEYQMPLLLWAVEEFSYKEIAASLEIPIGTVMSRLHRARQRLGVILHDFAVEEGVIRE